MKITGSEPANALHPNKNPDNNKSNGLSIRQEFACRFMQALLSSWGQHPTNSYKGIAICSISAADALIEELNTLNASGSATGK